MVGLLRRARVTVITVGLLVAVAGGMAGTAQAGAPEQAARALRLDPGARIGGNTQVTAALGQRLLGVPLRPNFMVGFGTRERIVGGAGNDQLGSRGSANEIHGRAGDDLLNGGRGDILDGGPGNDLIVVNSGGTIVHTGPGRDKVITSGRGSLITCAPGSHGTRIYASRENWIAPSCRDGSRVLFRAPPATAPPHARDAAQPVTGDGSNGNQYTAACDDPSSYPDCTVSSFPARTLAHFWSNEFVPAYLCPMFDHPYLLNQNFVPFGTQVDNGVEVQGLGPVGVYITGGSFETGRDQTMYWTGTYTGPGYSSATNWDGTNSSYQIILHCTSERDRASHTSP